MGSLLITRIKPNPAGKDRSRHGSLTVSQLGAEWVDFKNVGSAAFRLDGLELYHLAYVHAGAKPEWQKVMGFTGTLGVGATVRVHSGQVRDPSVLNAEDLRDADFHLFTGRDAFVWNNREGDSPGLWWNQQKSWEDKADYDPWPPEGAILVRSGTKLVPSQASGYRQAM